MTCQIRSVARSAAVLCLAVAVFLAGSTGRALAAAEDAGRNAVRQLFSFESQGDIDAIKTQSEGCDIIRVADNHSEGENCARLTVEKAKDGYGVFTLGPEAIKKWSGFDYFAMDVYVEEETSLCFELWDHDSKNYHTRFTVEDIKLHVGKNNVLVQINHAARNGKKDGLDWKELEPKDKIAMDDLKMVKIFTASAADHPRVLWIDNIRIMQEDAAKPKLKVALAPNAIAYDFGAPGTVCPGFQAVNLKTDGDFGLKDAGEVKEAGAGWPDLLTGTFVIGGHITFQAKVPNGKYHAWISAGRTYDSKYHDDYTLKINDVTLTHETPSPEEYFGEQHYFRFLHTQFSIKPHAVWLNYINRMFPAQTADMEVTDGTLTVEAKNLFLSALILVPAAEDAEFKTMVDGLQATRIKAFEQTYFAKPAPTPEREKADGEYVLWQPGAANPSAGGRASKKRPVVGPFTFPSDADRGSLGLTAAGALGQKVVLSLAVLPYSDLGQCNLKVTDLVGPKDATIPAGNIQVYWQNYRSNGEGVSEMGLIPGASLNCEANLTQCFWLWLTVPRDAQPGKYKATFTFTPEHGAPNPVPVAFEVYPFSLEPSLPYSFGMYGWAPKLPYLQGAAADARDVAVHEWARAIGFTARSIDCAQVGSVGKEDVSLNFDTAQIDRAKQCGFGTNAAQMQMVDALGIARAIGRSILPKDPGAHASPVDANPGSEFTSPRFKDLWFSAMKKYKTFLEKQPLPFAVQAVDEPREVPNPWNRNFKDTCQYGDWLREVGLRCFCTPMSDSQGGIDYTGLVDHLDIISVHAGAVSEKMVAATLAKHKMLWFYNTGMDRFSWGFFNWRTGSKGRWEWHFCDAGDGGAHGYPGAEWYNPFTEVDGQATLAPLTVNPQAMLWKSTYFQVAMGINDSAYLVTLEEAIAANQKAGSNAETVKKAQAFLDALKKVIPMTPGVAGIADADAGALVGKGAEDDAMYMAGEWRAQIADYLKVLAAKP